MPLSPASAPTLACGICDDNLTGLAGLGVVARLARFLGLPEMLAASVRLQRGGSAGQLLLALLYAACAGTGHRKFAFSGHYFCIGQHLSLSGQPTRPAAVAAPPQQAPGME